LITSVRSHGAQLLVAQKTQKTNLNKFNQRATCLQISHHRGRVENWVEQN